MTRPNRRRWTHLRVNSEGTHDVSLEDDIKTIFSLIESGNYDEALDYLDNLPIMEHIRFCETSNLLDQFDRSHPHLYPELCHMRASILTRLGEDNEAIKWYQKAIDADSSAAEPWVDKAGCHFRLGQFKEAFDCSKKAVAISARDPLAWEWMAKALSANGQNEQALNALSLGIESTGRHPSLLLVKASILAEKNFFEEAVQLTKEILSLNPENDSALYNQGIYLNMLGRLEEAIKAFYKALDLNEEAAGGYIWREIGVTLVILNKSDAETALLKTLNLFPGDKTTTEILCAYYLRKGEPQKAIVYLDRALQINPQSEELLSIKEKILRQINER